MSNAGGVHHIWQSKNGDGSYITYCHKKVWHFNMPIGLEHARLCVEKETYMRPCKLCLRIANRINSSSEDL
jgi:hypothetical protein